ncbi:hypothetical protein HPB52_018968 [Rhipicephalus sanguineus]|uniref:Uncharacterized protein n=1 Tax=Rhipicephalus sanguineus TaxID=34632 RepID=A0A9D4YQI7_RHISA|nr:hypothetical protein HPB52_018968 [Rhipicephalus sanguineus]
MDTRSTRRAASRTDADELGVGDEAGADGAAKTGGQQPSPGGTASSSRDPPVPLLETVRAWLADIFTFFVPVRDALARTQPAAALPKLDVPTFTGQAAGASVTDFLDDLSPRIFVAGPDRELSSVGPTGGNSAVAGVLDLQSFPDRRSPATKPVRSLRPATKSSERRRSLSCRL